MPIEANFTESFMKPFSVNLIAFPSRLYRIYISLLLSENTSNGTSYPSNTEMVIFFRVAVTETVSITSDIRVFRSNQDLESYKLPNSTCDISRISLIIEMRKLQELLDNFNI